MSARMPALERPPPNARERSCACFVALSPDESRCSFRSLIAPRMPSGPRIAIARSSAAMPMLFRSLTAFGVGAPRSAIDIRSRVALSSAGMPWRVMSARAAPTLWRETPKVLAADRMPVVIAPVRSSIRMLPAPTMALRTPIDSAKELVPLMPEVTVAMSALVVASRSD